MDATGLNRVIKDWGTKKEKISLIGQRYMKNCFKIITRLTEAATIWKNNVMIMTAKTPWQR